MITLRAIETSYKECRFLARLEARHAVLMDAMGVIWQYEREGFDLGAAGYYLPDFWLPAIGCWVEIKGEQATPGEIRKAVTLALASGRPVVIFHGEIDSRMIGGIATDNFYPATYIWAACEVCGWVDIVDLAASLCVHCPECKLPRRFQVDTLRTAYTAARSARFEHGERP